jgi:hypothetical protein
MFVKWTGAIALSTFLALSAAGCGTGGAPPPSNANTERPAAPDAVFKHEAAGIQFTVPAEWRAHKDGDRMSINLPDNSMTIVVYTATHENMAAVTDEVDRQIGKILKNVKVDGDLVSSTRNGLPVSTQTGTGELDGKPVEWRVQLLEAKQHVLVLSFGAPWAYDKHFADVSKFYESFRPI